MVGNEDHGVERLGRAVAETGERAARIGHVTGTAASGDNAITVSVSPGGMLRSVEIKPAVLGRHPDEVAREVLRLAGQATRTANARMHQSLRSVVDQNTARSLTDLGMPPGQAPHRTDDDDDYGRVLM
ncbi:YbaB/EbfC family nucleoid-associated protein [Actinocrispum sp. NPDC049592]|uniref:YbaB/EbfC family nucleoid-associated protein n=1 Tax=Actinocrispum sp. NPDC049592 TaxID=3154835 RepID=UPI003440D474